MTTVGRVRPNDPDTSWDAAASLATGKVAELQAAIYADLLEHRTEEGLGLTFDQLRRHVIERTGIMWSPSGVRTRTKELRELGWVRPLRRDGLVVKRPSDNGHPSTVWEACLPGEVTGTDPHRVPTQRKDRMPFDNEQMRAAIIDALSIYAEADRLDRDEPGHKAPAADRMADRLRDLKRVVVWN